MASYNILFTSTIFFILTSCCSHAKPSDNCPDEAPIRGGYWPSWKADNFPPSSIDTNYFNVIFYAFLNPNNVTFQFKITTAEAPLLKKFTSALHAKTPPVRAILSIGGGDEGASLFSRMASTKSTRSAFISSSIKVAKDYGFNGWDLDWEFPQTTVDMNNLAKLLTEWRAAAGKDFLITAAVYYSADSFLNGAKRTYPTDSIKKNLDWVNVMNYDYHGGWDTTATGAHAALYDSKTNLSTNFGIGRWIKAGVPRCMLVLGLPMYARTWTLKNAKSQGVGALATKVGPGDQGTMTYGEVVKYNEKHRATVVFDPDTVSVYSVSGLSWLGYDDTTSVAVKVSFAAALNLGGYFFWEVTGDYNWTMSKRASDVMLLLDQTSSEQC